MTYPNSPGAYPQQGQPAPWPPPPAQSSGPPRGSTWGRLGLAAAVIVAAVGGGVIGSLLTNRADTSATSDTSATTDASAAVTPEYVHAQDIKLCTEYALIIAATPKPLTPENGLLATTAAVRTSLAAYPDASENIRVALNAVVASYFAVLSNDANEGPKGLVDPPNYDHAAVQATYDRAWAICGLA